MCASQSSVEDALPALAASLYPPPAHLRTPAELCGALGAALATHADVMHVSVWIHADVVAGRRCASAGASAPRRDLVCLHGASTTINSANATLEALERATADVADLQVLCIELGGLGWLRLVADGAAVDGWAGGRALQRELLPFVYELQTGCLLLARDASLALRDAAPPASARGVAQSRYREMGHAFNNILASILGFTELARARLHKGDTAEVEGYLGEVRIAGQRGREAVADLLTYARGGGARLEGIDIVAPVSETVRLARDMMPAGVALIIEVSEALPEVLIDADDIGQICLQLCVRGQLTPGARGTVRVELSFVRTTAFRCSACARGVDPMDAVCVSVTHDWETPHARAAADAAAPFQATSFTAAEQPSEEASSTGGLADLVHSSGGHLRASGTQPGHRRVEVYLPALRAPSETV